MSYSVTVTRSGGGAVAVSRTQGPIKVVQPNNIGTLVSVAQAASSDAAADAAAAAASALAASASASAAASSASDAQTAQTAAELAETHAETAETNAETAETNAEAAQAAAEAAQAAAEAARAGAETAEANAETAETHAETAQAAAEAAQAAAEAAAASITLPLPIASGGTAATDAATARSNLSAAKSGANTDITSVYLDNTGLKVKDTDASHGLTLKPGSNLTADRTLTIQTGDTDRTLSINSNTTISGSTSGVNTGDQTITLTGDVTGTGTGSFAATIAADAVTNAKLADMAALTVKANATNGAANPTDVAAGTTGHVFRRSGTALAFGTLEAGAFATAPGIVTPAMLDNGSARSVLGVTGNSAAARADIQASAADQVMRANAAGTAVAFGAIDLSKSAAATGVIQAASFPALTGDVTTVAGALAATVVSASATAAGKVELATDAEAITGTDTARATTPANVAAVFGDKTGTSGHKIPFLDGANTWSAVQTWSVSSGTHDMQTSNVGTVLALTSTDAGATGGPNLRLNRSSASPAANDGGGSILWRGKDSGANDTDYGQIMITFTAVTDGAESGLIQVNTIQAGTFTSRLNIGAGAYMTGATGGDKGAGAFNATAVYDDNVLLTCYVLEAERNGGKIDLALWDDRVANRIIPAVTEKVITKEAVREEARDAKGDLVLQADGTFERLIAPAEFEIVEREPEQIIERTHEPARAFAEGRTDELDPAVFTAKWRASGVLPGMPTPEEWAANGPQSTGAMVQKLWELCELQAVHIGRQQDAIAALAERVAALGG